MAREEGFALTAAMVTALLCSIAAFTVLFMAISGARRSGFFRGRTTGRYLAEAGLVIAREKLMADPNYCPGGPCTPGGPCIGTEPVDTNNGAGGGFANGVTSDSDDALVTITVTNCGAGNNHVVSATMSY